MDSITIVRTTTENDIPSLIPLIRSYIVDFYQKPDPGFESIQQLVVRLLSTPNFGIQFVALQENCIVGFATLYFTFSTLQMKRAAILNDLFVHPDKRGQKIGESIFRYCRNYIDEKGFAYMQWETAQTNTVAQSLYKKMGGHISDWLVYEIKGQSLSEN